MFVTVSYNVMKTIILMIAFSLRKKKKRKNRNEIKIDETWMKNHMQQTAVTSNSCTIIIGSVWNGSTVFAFSLFSLMLFSLLLLLFYRRFRCCFSGYTTSSSSSSSVWIVFIMTTQTHIHRVLFSQKCWTNVLFYCISPSKKKEKQILTPSLTLCFITAALWACVCIFSPIYIYKNNHC